MNVVIIGNHLPRQCGLATFTSDVALWISRTLGEGSNVFVVAMNDRPEPYDYPPVVMLQVDMNDPRDYSRAADFINLSDVDIVCLQHEFGIFGGIAGNYVVDLLHELEKPVVTTIHTALPDPPLEKKAALHAVADLSEALIVMSRKAGELVQQCYDVPAEKLHFIHHGVPDMPFENPEEHKQKWGLEGKIALMTFGLLHRGKGVEYMIEAMQQIVERFPNTVYVVLGATHPPLVQREGEKYRLSLKARVNELGLERNVLFYDRFVSLEELKEFLAATDIYVTPYLDMRQVVSGTLAYAIGLGKAIVSTPYYYAQEILAEGRGILVPPRDPEKLSEAVIHLLSNREELEEMRKRAYEFGRRMTWPEVAKEYVSLFEKVLAGREARGLELAAGKAKPIVSLRNLPKPKLDYLERLTDSTGIFSQAHFDVPAREAGYRVEDNALALTAVILFYLQLGDPKALDLARIYLPFLRQMQRPDGVFHSRLNYDGSFGDEAGSDECQGKAIVGLGICAALAEEEGIASLAKTMLDKALLSLDISSPRAAAYAVVGCYHYLSRFPGVTLALRTIRSMGQKILECYENNASEEWQWFEDTLYCANGILPRALFLCYRTTGEEIYLTRALETLDFLTQKSCADNMFDLVGDQGWYKKGGEKARFRQLPIEAASLCSAHIDAYIITEDRKHLELAVSAFEWFLGRNVLKEPVCHLASFSCSDGIQRAGLDPDCGAEAAIHWLTSLLSIQGIIHLV